MKAGIRFNPETYTEIGLEEENITLKTIIDGVETDYEVTGGGGGEVQIEPLEVTENGTYTAPSGTAYSPVTVEVPELELDTLIVTKNDTYEPEEGHAYSSVAVDVPMTTLESITCQDNGEYLADYGKAWNQVIVNVDTYQETLEWTNPSPTSGFNTDKILGDFIPDSDFYRIVYNSINNNPDLTADIIVSTEDLRNHLVTIGSYDADNNKYFARAITIEAIELSQDPPMYEERIVAKGLCSEIGAANEKKFRAIPIEVYAVNLGR